MGKVCFVFEVHQPFRLNYKMLENLKLDSKFGLDGLNCENFAEKYFSGENRSILVRVAEKCYIPATQIVLDLLDGGFKCSFSISGVAVEQLEMWCSDALELFKQAANHKNCELLAQTYYHSLSSLFRNKNEFKKQIRKHAHLLKEVFGVKPKVFENTELIFNSSIASCAKELGFKAIYAEGTEKLLKGRSPNHVYTCNGIKVLVRNFQLSDDIAFRFSCKDWSEYPLTASKYADWLSWSSGDCINIFIDYETFGEHHWKESGILEFLKWLPTECFKRSVEFALPSEIAEMKVVGEIDAKETTSWADVEKDVSAWLGNRMQQTAFRAIEKAEIYAKYDRKGKRVWRLLQTSDHFYYMATKQGSSGEVHEYFSQSEPFRAFSCYMRALSHYEECCIKNMRRDKKEVARILKVQEPEKAFHFYNPDGSYTGISAYSLDGLAFSIATAPEECVNYHYLRGDLEKWVRFTVGDGELADEIREIPEPVKERLTEIIEERVYNLWSLLE